MLSKKAKVVRGETSKRITVLFQEWRAFKERAEEELRINIRKQERLQEEVSLKNQHIDKLTNELTSYRDIVIEQRHAIEGLVKRCSDVEKYRAKHSELDAQLAKERDATMRMAQEVRSLEELLHKSVEEKEALSTLNTELKSINLEQKRRLSVCEKDVVETTHELEMLEKMVGDLNNRRMEYGVTLLHAATDQTRGTTTPPPSTGRSRKTAKTCPDGDTRHSASLVTREGKTSQVSKAKDAEMANKLIQDGESDHATELSQTIDSLEHLISNSIFSKKEYK